MLNSFSVPPALSVYVGLPLECLHTLWQPHASVHACSMHGLQIAIAQIGHAGVA